MTARALKTAGMVERHAPLAMAGLILFLPLILIDPGTWLVLAIAGLAMGMMIFLMASGLTLVFGLMDVLNFAHGAFVAVGAYLATGLLSPGGPFAGLMGVSLLGDVGAMLLAILVACAAAGVLGLVFERVIVRRVYGAHLRQILITVGGLIVAEQLITVIWGADPIPLPKPETLRGSIFVGDIAVERYRLVACALGLVAYLGMHFALNRTRIGLLVRAGVENREMVEALGYRVRRLFVGVFVAGTALAAAGGVMWALYQEIVTVHIGADVMILVFIVVIIGGLGSVGGCFLGALLVGLTANFMGYLAPTLALGSNILLMVAVLLWRPRGLYPATKN
ncbi:branched-chain amino acid ABC transporter permease [Tistrella bauzanensis]|uniref:Branched-chain amino acid ABC transporter permease n=1 Tax=Tistrella arctica TaxID=3133430 RepID=A0ABU9YHN9_9PROT